MVVIIIYFSAICLANYFIIKQGIMITASAIVFYVYMNVTAKTSLIVSVLFQSLLLVVDYFAYAIIRILFSNTEMIEGRYMTKGILVVIFGKIILFLFVLLIKKNIVDKSTEILADSDWIRFLFFPVFTIGTVTAMISSFGYVENQKQTNVLIVIAIGLVGMNIVVFYLIEDVIEREFKIRENKIFEMKAKNQTTMYRSISIILSNLLNNAMEACEKCIDKKILKLKIEKEENNVIISVKNTYNHLLVFENDEIKTTKREHKEEHGNGIKNIVNTIEKYGGSYIIKNDKKEFYFSIIIPV